jgi:hypothetical protein
MACTFVNSPRLAFLKPKKKHFFLCQNAHSPAIPFLGGFQGLALSKW